jgi:hypothetical protein
VHLHNLQACFLLAGNAGDRTPGHLPLKPGSASGKNSSLTDNSCSKCTAAEQELKACKKTCTDISDLAKIVCSIAGQKLQNIAAEDATDSNLCNVAKHLCMMAEEAILHTVSSDTKKAHIKKLREAQKVHIYGLKEKN